MDKIIDLINNLRMRARDHASSEAEAMAALKHAERLMEEYALTESQLKRVKVARDLGDKESTQKNKAQHPVSKYTAPMIAEFCGVAYWWSPSFRKVVFFGFKADAEMAVYLFEMLRSTADAAWKEHWNSTNYQIHSRHVEYWSFHKGFCDRVNERMAALMAQRKGISLSREIVEHKQQLVEEGLKQLMPSLKIKVRKYRSKTVDEDTFYAGRRAGNKVNLNRPLGRKLKQIS